MGFFTEMRKKRQVKQTAAEFWNLLEGYRPAFTSFNGNLYEMATVRSAIHANATHRSKLNPEIVGEAYKELGKVIGVRMNPYQTTSQFLYKVSTILDAENSCIIVPLFADPIGNHITGFYPIHPQSAEVINHEGQVFLKYNQNGNIRTIEFEKVGIVTKMNYKSEIFGDNNSALYPTLDLIQIHNDSIKEAVKSSAAIRFVVRLKNVFKDDTMKAERERFVRDNLSGDNGGVMMFDQKYEEVKQINSAPVLVDDKQMTIINENVRDYFGISTAIIQNKFNSQEWAAYYEGNTEPFAIQMSQVLSRMLFSDEQLAAGCFLYLSANRLQYASNSEKIEIVTALFDRGMLSTNQGLDIFNMAPIGEEGDKRYIRKDYIDLSLLGAEIAPELIGKEV